MVIEAFDRVHLDGTGIDRITEDEVVAVVRDALSRGRGGRIITPNVDILRRASIDPEARRHLDDADLIVADGMPLIWASKLGGAPLPERVAGSSLIWSLSRGLGRDDRSIFVIGGAPAPRTITADPEAPLRTAVDLEGAAARARAALAGATVEVPTIGASALAGPTAEVPIVGRRRSSAAGAVTVREVRASGAVRAAVRLAAASPGLRIAGAVSPPFGFERDETSYAEVCRQVADARPDLVFVGLGFPKQELVIERLRRQLPAAWFVGCGAAVNFVAGDVHRAPRWMQRTGLEWAHRLSTEPRRLAGRYLRHDAPYALRLLARAPRRRSRRA
ncbi:WecB/TagA/CpsF family glycosyltransferase [Actinoplanes oblitus]|uniref:WecB/TagA/CpsF family glycosyltransferase n=1 Tax=Actinoplanes oblitus TaxID=3040509 RepID=A0ABY8WHT5_9ACTN|nr:WecB/TagA/CpsF family glycosyltransferase [Actinoplanes oblitus]WIM97238.1 WecB/TagA/CpsF family glycosyltransferase [Actinoplanes oblitus]